MIPKIFHQAWLGTAPMPDDAERWQESWRRQHPDWEFRFWTDDNIPLLQNVREFDDAPTPAAKANILRYELLLQFGGVWLDLDMECLKPLDSLLAKVPAFVAKRNSTDICIAALGAAPNHPFFQSVAQNLPAHYATHRDQVPVISCGGRYVHSLLTSEAGQDVVQFPPPVFFPYDYADRNLARQGRERRSTRGSYAIHYYLHSWAPRPQDDSQNKISEVKA
jgi:mannosyltransferase OCH1-like enzyme